MVPKARNDPRFISLRPRKSRRGVTLLEVLTGLAIFTVLATSLALTISTGVRLVRKADCLGDYIWETLMISEKIDRDVENAGDLQDPFLMPGSVLPEENVLTLILPANNGISRVRYYLENDVGSQSWETTAHRQGTP